MGITEDVKKMMAMQDSFDKCTICKKIMPPGTPSNKLYDDKLGEISVCVGCTLKSILCYMRNMHEAPKG